MSGRKGVIPILLVDYQKLEEKGNFKLIKHKTDKEPTERF